MNKERMFQAVPKSAVPLSPLPRTGEYLICTSHQDTMKRMTDYFNKANSVEETIPRRWLTDPLPPAPKKRRVGRPNKKIPADTCVQATATRPTTPADVPQVAADATGTEVDVITVAAATTLPPDPDVSQVAADAKETEVDATTVAADTIPADASQVAAPGTPTMTSKRGKYKYYTLTEKLAIAAEAKMHGIRPVASLHKISPSTVIGWMKLDPKESRTRRGRLPGGGRPVTYGKEMDENILGWILKQREQQIPVSGESIMAYTKSMVDDIKFHASRGWLEKFMRRHHLSLRTRTSMAQKLPADLEDKVSNFHQFIHKLRQDMDYNFIINMDETPAYFDIVPNKTINTVGAKDVKIRTTGCEKRHLTIVLAITSDGDVLPTMIIFKGKRQLKDIKAPSDILVRVQEKAWMDTTLMIDWCRSAYRQFTHRAPSMLVLDSFRAHLCDPVKKEIRKANGDLAVIPGGCTSILQPLDVSINKPFKSWLRKHWVHHMQSEVERMQKEGGDGRLRPPTKQQIVDWVTDAVHQLKGRNDMIRRSFVATGISPKLNGAEDHHIRCDDYLGAPDFNDSGDEADFLGFTEEDVAQAEAQALQMADEL